MKNLTDMKKAEKQFFKSRGRVYCCSSSCFIFSFLLFLLGIILFASKVALTFALYLTIFGVVFCLPCCILCSVTGFLFFTVPNVNYDEENPPVHTNEPILKQELTISDVSTGET